MKNLCKVNENFIIKRTLSTKCIVYLDATNAVMKLNKTFGTVEATVIELSKLI